MPTKPNGWVKLWTWRLSQRADWTVTCSRLHSGPSCLGRSLQWHHPKVGTRRWGMVRWCGEVPAAVYTHQSTTGRHTVKTTRIAKTNTAETESTRWGKERKRPQPNHEWDLIKTKVTLTWNWTGLIFFSEEEGYSQTILHRGRPAEQRPSHEWCAKAAGTTYMKRCLVWHGGGLSLSYKSSWYKIKVQNQSVGREEHSHPNQLILMIWHVSGAAIK